MYIFLITIARCDGIADCPLSEISQVCLTSYHDFIVIIFVYKPYKNHWKSLQNVPHSIVIRDFSTSMCDLRDSALVTNHTKDDGAYLKQCLRNAEFFRRVLLMTVIQGGEDEEYSSCWDEGSGSGFGTLSERS